MIVFTISAFVPVICGVTLDGDVARHFCNAEGPYSITVVSDRPFQYGDRSFSAGTHLLTFTGPEKAEYIIKQL